MLLRKRPLQLFGHAASRQLHSAMSSKTMSAAIVDPSLDPSLGPAAIAVRPGQPIPTPSHGQVLIKVSYAGVNRPDIMQRKGLYPPPPGASPIMGLEASGEVIAVGGQGGRFSVGDEVCALLNGGGYAEYAVVPQGQCMRIPKGVGLKDAASLPEAFCTAWSNIYGLAGLKAGQKILVHGGSSGVGTAAIQLCRALGSSVYTTAGSQERCRQCDALGADMSINYKESDFEVLVRERLGRGNGLDVVLDMVGGEYVNKNLKLLGRGGRHISIAFLGGAKAALDLTPLLVRGVSMTGSTLRPKTDEQKVDICRSLEEVVWPLIEDGKIRPVVSHTLTFGEVARAHELLEGGHVFGKLVMKV